MFRSNARRAVPRTLQGYRHFSSKLRIFSAQQVFPTEPKHVTVEINNRDDKQSNVGSAVEHCHTLELAELINQVVTPAEDARKPFEHSYPGCVQTWGGTFPMFAIWKRGLLPFAELVDLFTATRGVPTMWLDRNICLNGMAPYDIPMMDAFFEQIRVAKVEANNKQPFVMQVFDAVNDPKQLEPVINAYKAKGPDFAVMLYYSTSRTLFDPALMNSQRAANFFKLMEEYAPTDYNGLKQPEGCLSAHQMEVLCAAVREAQPHKALHVHTQGIHGLSELQAIAAAKGGATSIDAAIPFHSLAGQPFAPALREELIRNGFRVNAWDLDKVDELIALSKRIESFYPQVSKPDRRYPSVAYGANIAGGQSSILRDELNSLGIGHYYPQVEECNPITRRGAGSGIAVTPLADTFVRQTMALVREGVSASLSKEDKHDALTLPLLHPSLTRIFEQFVMTDAYALLLMGDNGLLPSYPHPTLLRKAAEHVAKLRLTQQQHAGTLTPAQAESLAQHTPTLAAAVLHLSQHVRTQQHAQQLEQRMEELRAVSGPQRAQLELDISLSGMRDFEGHLVTGIEARASLFQAEQAKLAQQQQQQQGEGGQGDGNTAFLSADHYASFLLTGELSTSTANALFKAVPGLSAVFSDAGLTDHKAQAALLAKCAPLTVAAYKLKTDRLGPAKEDIKLWESKLALSLPEELVVCHGLFKGHVLSLTEDLVTQRYCGVHKRWGPLSTDSAVPALPSLPALSAPSTRVVGKTAKLYDVVGHSVPAAQAALLEALAQQAYWQARKAYRTAVAALPDSDSYATQQLQNVVGGDESKVNDKLSAATAAVDTQLGIVKAALRSIVEAAPPGHYDGGVQRINCILSPARPAEEQVQALLSQYTAYARTLANYKWKPAI